jgi:hypothetical protein
MHLKQNLTAYTLTEDWSIIPENGGHLVPYDNEIGTLGLKTNLEKNNFYSNDQFISWYKTILRNKSGYCINLRTLFCRINTIQ